MMGAMVLVMLLGWRGWWGWQVPAQPCTGSGASGWGGSCARHVCSRSTAPKRRTAEEQAMQLRMESQLSAQNALDALLTTPPPPPLRACRLRRQFPHPPKRPLQPHPPSLQRPGPCPWRPKPVQRS